MIILETKRLTLRKMTLGDAYFQLQLMNSPHYIKSLGDRGVKTLEEAKHFITVRYLGSYDQYGYGPYMIELKETGSTIGCAGLHKRDFLPDPDIGYAIMQEYSRKGYIYEASLGIIQYAREDLKLKKILAAISPHNTASLQLIEKLNFQFEKEMNWPDGNKITKIFGKNFK